LSIDTFDLERAAAATRLPTMDGDPVGCICCGSDLLVGAFVDIVRRITRMRRLPPRYGRFRARRMDAVAGRLDGLPPFVLFFFEKLSSMGKSHATFYFCIVPYHGIFKHVYNNIIP